MDGLVARGVTISETVSGDPGCREPKLRDNALRLRVESNGHAASEIYLFEFRDRRRFDASKAAFDACTSEHASQAADAPLEALEASPYRAYGVGWDRGLRRTLEEALDDAAHAP